MPEILDWQGVAHAGEVVWAAAQALAAGRLVAVPTETNYALAASALIPEAVERLCATTGNGAGADLTLVPRGPEDAADWVPGISALGRRLARRCWPGPVELAWGSEWESGLAGRLDADVRQRLTGDGHLVLRLPAHEVVRYVVPVLPSPVVLAPLGANGHAALTADHVLQVLADDSALVIDAGPCRYGQPATRVRVAGNSWQVVREGVVPPGHLEQLTGCLIQFVCTGNTCRSPLAEALCKKLLAERLGCTPDELPRRGYVVQSAGLAATRGGPAAAEAVAVAAACGADLTRHVSQPLTAERAAQADHLIAMTQSHLQALVEQFPALAPRARLLAPDGEDVPDPIGSGREVYEACARQILRHLERLLPEVQQA